MLAVSWYPSMKQPLSLEDQCIRRLALLSAAEFAVSKAHLIRSHFTAACHLRYAIVGYHYKIRHTAEWEVRTRWFGEFCEEQCLSYGVRKKDVYECRQDFCKGHWPS